ncbi:hypothetical protein ABZ368_15335 [Streptomyces sp. NPDC005908]|uniref:hypothetical protein n=1 Tax=Streptomyces sp. NPDC005908 TaxID=3157084 RepID=UPI0033D3A16C
MLWAHDEHELERAYRVRITRAAQTDDTLRQLVDHTRQTVTLQQREAKAVPLIPVTVDHPGFTSVPDGARYPHTIQLVTDSLLPADTDEALQDSAQELFTDLTNQFGLD